MIEHIRNFCIIAHIDHGKSTLADRILDAGGTVSERERMEQLLDSMDLERERGITIKAHSVRIPYKDAATGAVYSFNLIDTPGHVDFSYEVSKSLSACEGALLVVDAVQSVQAQTLANVYLALDSNLEIIPVINKIDLPSARPDVVKRDIEDIIGLDASEAILVSAKTGLGVDRVMDAIVRRIPPPKGNPKGSLKALVFDSWFDPYQGAAVLARVFDGEMRKGTKITLMRAGRNYEVLKVGVFTPQPAIVERLGAGEVGFVIAGIRDVADARVGDTITETDRPVAEPLAGFKEAKPMVFAGIYPTDSVEYEPLRDALHKLRLNDSSFTFEPETSQALGFGFRLGFLGLLHMEIIQERLEREYDLSLITTAPTVSYRVHLKDGSEIEVDNPAHYPPIQQIEAIDEPVILATIYTPEEYVGPILKLCEDKRGVQRDLQYLTAGRVVIKYELPFNEVVLDFYDRLKSITRGYASLEYEFLERKPSDLVKLDILINGDAVDSLSQIVHRDKAYYRGRALCSKMKELIPRQLFEVVIQAAIGAKIIARTRVAPLRKDVTAKCYGGDITRKRKLLEKQKEGKRRMKRVGHVELPQEAFLAILKVEDSGR